MEIITVRVIEDITVDARVVGAVVTEDGNEPIPVWFPYRVIPFVYAGDYRDMLGQRWAGGFVAYSVAVMDGLFVLPDGILTPHDHPAKITQFERFAGRIQNWPANVSLRGE